MKKERNFLPLYMQALQIPSGIFILTWKELIPGGPTGLKPEKKMPDGKVQIRRLLQLTQKVMFSVLIRADLLSIIQNQLQLQQ